MAADTQPGRAGATARAGRRQGWDAGCWPASGIQAIGPKPAQARAWEEEPVVFAVLLGGWAEGREAFAPLFPNDGGGFSGASRSAARLRQTRGEAPALRGTALPTE